MSFQASANRRLNFRQKKGLPVINEPGNGVTAESVLRPVSAVNYKTKFRVVFLEDLDPFEAFRVFQFVPDKARRFNLKFNRRRIGGKGCPLAQRTFASGKSVASSWLIFKKVLVHQFFQKPNLRKVLCHFLNLFSSIGQQSLRLFECF